MAVAPTSATTMEVAVEKVQKAGGKRKRPSSSSSSSSQEKPSDPQASAVTTAAPPTSPSKRNKSPGVRVIGGRIYDSERGKTCHQCRQKTIDFAASCKNVRGNKICTFHFCHKCLLNRYGEKAEVVAALSDWNCPKCRDVCNCSFCRKRKGHQPTGILVHTAKATGFSSVLEMLHRRGSEGLNAVKDGNNGSSPLDKSSACSKLVASKRKHDKEGSYVQMRVPNLRSQASKPDKDVKERLQYEITKRSKLEKLNQENGDKETYGCKTSHVGKEKEIFPGKKIPEEGLDESIKKEEGIQERGGASPDGDQRKLSVIGKKFKGCSIDGNAHDCKISNVDEEKENFHENISQKVLKNSMKKEELDERKGLSSSGNEKKVLAGENGNSFGSKPLLKFIEPGKHVLRSVGESPDADTGMPQGTALTTVAGIKLQAEDVGPALQFLEFCSAFGKVLGIKKGQPESVLRELTHGRFGRRGLSSLIVQFHIKLLSTIRKEMGEEESLSSAANNGSTWLQALKKCINESQCTLKELPLDCFNKGAAGYVNLDPSKKLRVLNFLCDEILRTEKLRSWIDEQNRKFVERKKEAQEKILAAKEKEKRLKQKLKDGVAQAMLALRNGAPLTVSEHDNLVSKIKTETEKAHAEMLGCMDLLPKTEKQRPDAVRTEPILLEGSGRAYWRLKGYNVSHIMLQDIGNWDFAKDKWFVYDDVQEKEVEKHISSLRGKLSSQDVLTVVRLEN